MAHWGGGGLLRQKQTNKKGSASKKSLGITAQDYCAILAVAEMLCCMLWNGHCDRFGSIRLFGCCYQAALWKGLLISNVCTFIKWHGI